MLFRISFKFCTWHDQYFQNAEKCEEQDRRRREGAEEGRKEIQTTWAKCRFEKLLKLKMKV